MKFWNKICGFVLILFFIAIHTIAQNKIPLTLYNKSFSFKNYLFNPDTTNSRAPLPFINGNTIVRYPIPQGFSTLSYGFFCREELKIEKATRLPLRFRLGSLQQCNYYEGKE